MKLTGLFIAAASGLVFLRSVLAVELAVGFSLSLDYGVSSIYYANGSTVGVAKIEGSPAYKAIMYAQPWGNQTISFSDTQSNISLQQTALVINTVSWLDHLPEWLRGSPEPSVVTMSQMLQGLKAATESYLASKISYVNIAIPDEATETFTDILSSGARRASLKQDGVGRLQATVWATHANQVDDYLCEEPSRLLLSLDYSRAALTATVIEDDCGIEWVHGTIHDKAVGTHNWSDESWTKLVPELRQLIADARVKSGLGSQTPISKIVLLGESARDQRLKNVMRDVLLDKDEAHASIPWEMHGSSRDLLEPVDPLFAPAAGVASRALMLLDDEEKGHLCQAPFSLKSQIPSDI